MANIFNSVLLRRPKRNRFNLSYDHKFSCNLGQLIPFHIQEVIAGDTFIQTTKSLIRFSPLLAPVMHEVNVYQHFFFVPNRILWDGWEDFYTGEDPERVAPVIGFGTASVDKAKIGSLADYLGIVPTKSYENTDGKAVSALPFAAYQRIWYDYYRDENLQQEDLEDFKLVDGYNGRSSTRALNLKALRNRAWQKDYFTSALPFPQKGPEVLFPLQGMADVGTGEVPGYEFGDAPSTWRKYQGAIPASGETKILGGMIQDSDGKNIHPTNLKADLSTAEGGTSIEEFRKALRLQEFLEKSARVGTRYIEVLKGFFGASPSDARLQRPEFLGGSLNPVVISEVLQTSETNVSNTALGTQAGHAISLGGGKRIKYNVQEPGFIIGIQSVMPRPAYFQGISRMWTRLDRLAYFWPQFAHLGEQEILNKELFYQGGGNPADDEVFGYTPRYAEYRYNASRVSAEFREDLDFWHLARKFENLPTLSEQFIKLDPTESDLNRIYAVTDKNVHGLYCHVYNQITAVRPMPKYATPAL